MAVHQYIGARYVPKFYENSLGTAEWQAGVMYEPLTIVTYNGNSYTSKKPVPASVGNPSSNTEFWVATGLYNEQINEMLNAFNDLEEDFDNFKDDVNEQIENINARKVIFIGDSYCGVFGTYPKGIYTCFINTTKLTDNVNCWLYAIGGAGFAGAGMGKTFGDLLDDALAAHTDDAEEITDVFICGGANDVSEETADINAGKDAAFAFVRTNFPNAILHVAMVSGFIDPADRKPLMNKVRYVYYYDLPNRWVKIIANAHFPMMLMSNFTDNVHPTGNACKQMGLVLADHFFTGDSFCEFGNSYHVTANIPHGTATTSNLYIEMEIDKTGFTIWNDFNRVAIGISESLSVTHNGGITFEVGEHAALAGIGMLCPNALSTTDNEPIYSIPCSIMGFSGDYSGVTWCPIAGELIGIVEESTVKWYFKSNTAVKSITMSDARWSMWRHHIGVR